MKKIKLSLNFLPMILLMGLTVFMTSCEKDPCKDVDCGDNGICIEGICDCDAGYEGVNCEIITATKYVGQWDALDQCSPSGQQAYDATISKSSNDQITLLINNFSGVGTAFNINATIVDANSFTIPSQTVGGVPVSGSGTISSNGNTINVNYSITLSGQAQDNCNGTWTKK